MTAFKRIYSPPPTKEKMCRVCAKRKPGRKECLVLKKAIGMYQDCWAWTDDPDWKNKVNIAIHKYKYNKEYGS